MSVRSETIVALRDLIVASAPEPEKAEPVLLCGADDPLDSVIPFSSLMILGTVIAIEDHFSIEVTRGVVEDAALGGFTLRKLATIIETLEQAQRKERVR